MSHSTLSHSPKTLDFEAFERAIGVSADFTGSASKHHRGRELICLVEDIGRRLQLKANMCVLDIGCGIGQLSKALIERFDCQVIGIEESRSMHSLSPAYVLSERFTIWSPETLAAMVRQGFRADAAVAVRISGSRTEVALALKPGACVYGLEDA